ncbi:hypothetical protein EST38_g4607 [Candolleomyces aberdarensis]|uniref:RING-type domain-containing protein n=1 Tax=Candolleomyces aberdarensis TaxID=2316362 RepID=A0A4Q2DP92_9AGAR|nr:hypothetical protein EST38_g4607 [Candolleomyces aberdarensis]
MLTFSIDQLQQTFWRRPAQPTAPATNLDAPPRPGTGIDHLLPQNDPNGNATSRDKKSLDPLFGPNIGAVTSGPAWTATGDKKIPTQPTTTLQALVNLKRPTIKLSPLHHDEPQPDDGDHGAPHGLEFEYDCDAPKCGIYVHVFLPKSHPDAPPAPPHHPYAKLLVFESVVEGGFSKHLKFDDGAVLELGHFEHTAQPETEASKSQSPTTEEQQQQLLLPPPPPSLTALHQEPSNRSRRRFTALRFRRVNGANRGPALAVVDAEPQGTDGAAAPDGKKDGGKADEDGVKVTIRLAALDEQGTELSNINEQVTYLHIVRVGTKPVPAEGAEHAEDTRPYVVKVVKREATIGPHTFHLHEIYGLTSTSTSKETHNYPPVETNTAVISDLDEDPQSECLLCLSSPREVVLLPCRHLVACKECALNMVEFGAGGNITQSDGVVPSSSPVIAGPFDVPGNQVDGGQPTAGPGGVTGITITANGAANARRKRKAKGWFCPVCRQPPPGDSLDSKDQANPNNPNSVMDGLPTLASLSLGPNSPNVNNGNPESPRTGFFGRPNFLRTFTGRAATPTTPTMASSNQLGMPPQAPVEMTATTTTTMEGLPSRPLDVESGAGIGRTGT